MQENTLNYVVKNTQLLQIKLFCIVGDSLVVDDVIRPTPSLM